MLCSKIAKILTKYSASFVCCCSVKQSQLLATMCGSLAISWGATASGTQDCSCGVLKFTDVDVSFQDCGIVYQFGPRVMYSFPFLFFVDNFLQFIELRAETCVLFLNISGINPPPMRSLNFRRILHLLNYFLQITMLGFTNARNAFK